MNSVYDRPNRVQTARLAALQRLTDEQLGRRITEHWTVAVALAHLAYWDALALGSITAWRQHHVPPIPWLDAEDGINDVLLPAWRSIPVHDALERAILAAEALDGVVASFTLAEAAQVANYGDRLLDRAQHRMEHLDEIDQVVN